MHYLKLCRSMHNFKHQNLQCSLYYFYAHLMRRCHAFNYGKHPINLSSSNSITPVNISVSYDKSALSKAFRELRLRIENVKFESYFEVFDIFVYRRLNTVYKSNNSWTVNLEKYFYSVKNQENTNVQNVYGVHHFINTFWNIRRYFYK